MLRFPSLASLWLGPTVICALANFASAQQPTQEQRDAIRASCRSDFIADCPGVEPGGRAAFECLVQNKSKLSLACDEAVNAVAAKPGEPPTTEPVVRSAPAAAQVAAPPASTTPVAQAPVGDDPLKSVQKACTISDMMAHCSWIKPGNPEILQCLKANSSDLSPGCQSVVQSLPANAPAASPNVETERRAEQEKKPVEAPKKPTGPERATTEAAPKQPTAQQKSAIRAACRTDFMSHCSGVQPGGTAAVQCLQSNATRLSSGCRRALAAVT